MIDENTPYKLADIIRDTWPGLYRAPKTSYNVYAMNYENEERFQSNSKTRKENY